MKELIPIAWVLLDRYALAAIAHGANADPYVESFRTKEEAEDFMESTDINLGEFEIAPTYLLRSITPDEMGMRGASPPANGVSA